MGGEPRTADPQSTQRSCVGTVQGELVGPEKRVHLLVVDDEPPVLAICKAYIERAGRVAPEGVETVLHSARGSAEAMEIAREIYGSGERICFSNFR